MDLNTGTPNAQIIQTIEPGHWIYRYDDNQGYGADGDFNEPVLEVWDLGNGRKKVVVRECSGGHTVQVTINGQTLTLNYQSAGQVYYL